jgi:chemotaxis protein methyltransferase CheR
MAVATAEREYQFLKRFLRGRMGYDLGNDKSYLVESRLNPLAAAYQFGSWQDLVHAVESDPRTDLGETICDAMTTNETSFFRDRKPFDLLKKSVIPDLIKRRERTRSLKIWCGASATGQEPVSFVITIREHFPELANWNLMFLATDISRSALDRARVGVFSQFEVQRGMPIQLLIKHFRQNGDVWNVSEDIKRVIQYRKFNLMDGFTGLGGPFDLHSHEKRSHILRRANQESDIQQDSNRHRGRRIPGSRWK